MYRIFSEPAGTGITWVVMNVPMVDKPVGYDHMKWTYTPTWRVYRYMDNLQKDMPTGCPKTQYTYTGKTIVCGSILEALDEAANPWTSWLKEPLSNEDQFELVSYGDGESWVLVAMHPQYGSKGNLHGWLNTYHPNNYRTFETELQVLGVPMPKHLERFLEGEAMYDLSGVQSFPCLVDWDTIRTREASEQAAFDVLNKHYFC